jgi:hypothetical protein
VIRAGELLKAMKQSGERQKQGQASGGKSNGRNERPLPPKLSNLGISKDQSSQWQKLADRAASGKRRVATENQSRMVRL